MEGADRGAGYLISRGKLFHDAMVNFIRGTTRKSLSTMLKLTSDLPSCNSLGAHDLDLLFEGQRFESRPFGRLNLVISQTVTDIAN